MLAFCICDVRLLASLPSRACITWHGDCSEHRSIDTISVPIGCGWCCTMRGAHALFERLFERLV